MALVEHCFCCSVHIASGFFALYLLIAYMIAFAFELLWILEAAEAMPAAAVLLTAGYFTMALFAALLIHGLATKNTLCLIAWMFSITTLTFPEAGMVIYMSIQYWRIETLYGITELSCWFVRIVINVIEIILIQSLYTTWKDEELLLNHLRDLQHMSPVPTLEQQTIGCYQNNGYEHHLVDAQNTLKRATSTPSGIWNVTMTLPNNLNVQQYDSLQYCTTQSEFNANVFMQPPNHPLTPNISNQINNNNNSSSGSKRAQSLIDLRQIEPPQNGGDNLSALRHRYGSVDGGLDGGGDKKNVLIRNRTGFYAQPIPNYGVPIYYGPLDGPDFLIYRKQCDKLTSKNSLSLSNASADDVHKYRDVAL